MSTQRKLMLLDPERRLLKEFQATTEKVVSEANELMDSVPKFPNNELAEEDNISEWITSAQEVLDCMLIIQQQVNVLKGTYSNMKKYVEGVCINTHTSNIEAKTAIGFLSSRTQFDQKRFKDQNYETYMEYIKQTAPFLVVKQKK